jgi:hypothetical protein
MTTVERGRCASCGTSRPLRELLRATDRTGQAAPRLYCRPGLGRGCLDGLGGRDRWSISQADPTPSRTGSTISAGGAPSDQDRAIARILANAKAMARRA